MNDQLKACFVDIGRRGGATASKAKVAAVRANGAKVGRPRKDGLRPGARLLDVAGRWIDEAPDWRPRPGWLYAPGAPPEPIRISIVVDPFPIYQTFFARRE
jgi:hypothetical protein